MEKINIAELLKDCPQGMELDCTVYNDVTFLRIDDVQNRCYFKAGPADTFWTTCEGRINGSPFGKCVIFPKGKTTWEGFVPSCKFKDGDILVGKANKPFIFQSLNCTNLCYSYCGIDISGQFRLHSDDWTSETSLRFATEEEKQELFDAIKANGYKWNEETKTLEELTEQKFDITTLKPLESRVLVRDCNSYEWEGDIFTRYAKSFNNCNFVTLGGQSWKQCIPYNDDTKHLLGTTDDCDEYYKTWE